MEWIAIMVGIVISSGLVYAVFDLIPTWLHVRHLEALAHGEKNGSSENTEREDDKSGG